MTAVIGELTWEGGAWVGVGKLPAWAGIDVCVSEDDARRQTPCAARPIGVRMVAPGAPGAPPSREQFAAYEVLLADEGAIVTATLAAIFVSYARQRDAFLRDQGSSLAHIVPPIEGPDGLRDLVCLNEVHVHVVDRNGIVPVGLELSCSWDPEHGVGVLLHGDRVVRVGDASIAFHRSDDTNNGSATRVSARGTSPRSSVRLPMPAPRDAGAERAASLLRLRRRCHSLAGTVRMLESDRRGVAGTLRELRAAIRVATEVVARLAPELAAEAVVDEALALVRAPEPGAARDLSSLPAIGADREAWETCEEELCSRLEDLFSSGAEEDAEELEIAAEVASELRAVLEDVDGGEAAAARQELERACKASRTCLAGLH
ncbi:MAG: hypothetical protein H6709_23360 [Kofleriaceae bacterium]|nr:hypothetical protein [Myxococcales bacterium]MCB9562832.1 hypothetical protein [Kofleriaceae bacterium]MCB9575024.1 hypothetical protein [Kofleriaceae bacterium]